VRDGGADRFSLTVPARAGLVGMIRVFASAVARHYGIADDVVEDVKLAVSEACTDPIDAGAGGELVVAIGRDGAGLVYEVTSGRWEPAAPPTELPAGIDPAVLERLQVVRALFTDAERSEEAGGLTVRFSTASRTSSG
jgi:anti-sigma regulatory factor (Ser/Thr protein kinase)